jgi:hypothetical protein
MSNESKQPGFEAYGSSESGWWVRCEGGGVVFNLTEPVARQLASDLNAATANAKIAGCAKEWAEAKAVLIDAEHTLTHIIELCAGRAYEINARLDIDDARKVHDAAESALLAAAKEPK